MGILRQVAEYLYLKKKDPNAPDSDFLRKMHWINRTSILLFIVAIIVMVVRYLTRK